MRLAAPGHLAQGEPPLTRRSRLPRFHSLLARSAVWVALTISLSGPATAADIALPQARSRMRETHEALKAAAYEVREREAEVGAADALLWPKLEANALVTRIDGPIVIDLDPIRQVILALHPGVPAAAALVLADLCVRGGFID